MSKLKFAFTVLALAALACLLVAASFADSQARIVRLSQVDGSVQVDRNAGQGYEKAFLNLPITQGTKIRTERGGRAEVEFEDGSTLRITPGTVVEFPELSLRDSGGRANAVKIGEGQAYLNFKGTKDDEFILFFGREKLTLTKPAHLRVQMADLDATMALFKGDVEVSGPAGTVDVDKKQTVTFDFADSDRYTVANSLEPDPYDSWDKQQDAYQQRYSASSNSYSPYGYGMSDLNYYGNYFSLPGYGLMWQPYFAGLGWDPFMNGAWYAYPGFGYTFVSAYPWGWTPYRYGSWIFLPSYGWAWQPGTSWAAWNNVPVFVNPPRGFNPPKPPATGVLPVIVSRGPVVTPAEKSSGKLVIHSDSAGLGIARGSLRDLGRISQQVNTQGFVAARIHSAPVGSAFPSSGMGASSRGISARGGVGMSASASASHAGSGHAGGGSHK
jgi:FecR protein